MKLLILTIITMASLTSHSVEFPDSKDFFFGVSNAPAQVEDQLDDPWMKFARQGKFAAFLNQHNPEDKLQFWTRPEIELDLAVELGVDVFRLGIDWARLMRLEPPYRQARIDLEALERYAEILKMIKQRGMRVMLSLFHHAEPDFTLKEGSWHNPKTKDEFLRFVEQALPRLIDDIDYLITFNEPQLYVVLTQLSPIWPSYMKKGRPLGLFNFGWFKGRFEKSLNHISQAHNRVYVMAKRMKPELVVGIAHNVSDYKAYRNNVINRLSTSLSWKKMNFLFLDKTIHHMDFIGLNYYGVEKVKNFGITLDPAVEYSDSGRGISPHGLYEIVHTLNERYSYNKLPFIITENGVADETDETRPAYLVEHLKVVRKLMDEGIRFLGYVHWTLTDNFEWADGYCPKFGLVEIDRETNKRSPRESFYLYRDIIQSREISADQLNSAWKKNIERSGKARPTCRDKNGVGSLDEYRYEKFKGVDWRFR